MVDNPALLKPGEGQDGKLLSAGLSERAERWGRAHDGVLGIVALLLAVAAVIGVVVGAFADAWEWVYAREVVTLAVVGLLGALATFNAYRVIALRTRARREVQRLQALVPSTRELPPAEARRRLDAELRALKRMAEAAGMIVSWEPDWRFRIRRSGGRERNLFTLDLASDPIETRVRLRTELRSCEARLRKEGARVSPALLDDP
jgi:hypothetical protein